MQTSARRQISHPSLDRSDRPDIPAHIKNLVDALEKDISGTQGVFASRPANPAYSGYVYWATDQNVLSYWDGIGWHDVGTVNFVPKTIVDAKGDLIVATLADTVTRLPVGNNDEILIADAGQATGLKWGKNQVVDMVTAKGDILAATAADALARVGVGSNGQALIADSAQATGVKWGTAAIPQFMDHLGSDVVMTNADTYYPGPSRSLVAGTWLVMASVSVARAGSGPFLYTAKLWDGTTAAFASAAGVNGGSNGDVENIAVMGTVTLASTTTILVSVSSTGPNSTIKSRSPASNHAGDTATTLTCVQLG